MRYIALACDYDGTLATDGVVDDLTIAALERVKASNRRLLLVTGRELEDLLRVFPRAGLFDRIVAENGAILYAPDTRESTLLGEPPPPAFVDELRARGVVPLSVGHVIVATWQPMETLVLATIRDLGLEHQVIFNKGAVMILPPGVNKATGLRAALRELSISTHNTVGVGDAENDHAFLAICERAIAVVNALPMLKERSDYVTRGERGAGVVELAEKLVGSDLSDLGRTPERHLIHIGALAGSEEPLAVSPADTCVMIAGASGSGKSTLAMTFLERLMEREYQCVLVDPEGDYASFEDALVLGDPKMTPAAGDIAATVEQRLDTVIINLLGIPLDDRPTFFVELFDELVSLRKRMGRPHWLFLDEAHHLLPRLDTSIGVDSLASAVLITVHPEQVNSSALERVDLVLAVGERAGDTLASFADAVGASRPAPSSPEPGEALAWWCRGDGAPVRVRADAPKQDRQRHRRKYAQGELGADKSFYFRGPEGRLNLRANNLAIFSQIAEGVDDETWEYHLERRDYSNWVRQAIKDDELAADLERVEVELQGQPLESRRAIIEAIGHRYTRPVS
jgi:hydroxymethylpyrimidine pyrophosphatase-like HAD family hydrolase/energy-coupling factor transporter ATP-binding protein EcfA2